MNDLASRLREARIAAGFRHASDAVERFGWKGPTYLGHENGSRGFKAATAQKYARAFSVETDWLLFGRGDAPIRNAGVLPDHYSTDASEPAVMVPVYDIAASAGPGTYVDYEVQVAQMSLPRNYIKSLTSTPPDQLAIISVKGDSMVPTLNDGDIVLVDGAKTSGSFDGLFVINFDGTLHIKRLARGSKPGTVRILSDNSAYYPPVDANIEDLHIIGRVRWAAGAV